MASSDSYIAVELIKIDVPYAFGLRLALCAQLAGEHLACSFSTLSEEYHLRIAVGGGNAVILHIGYGKFVTDHLFGLDIQREHRAVAPVGGSEVNLPVSGGPFILLDSRGKALQQRCGGF